MKAKTGDRLTDHPVHRFRAMGTTVSLIGPARHGSVVNGRLEHTAREVQDLFDRFEARFSRFRPDSEVSRVNARSGVWTVVSRPFANLLAFSLAAARETGGLFDPTVLEALEAAGYDRDWEEIRREGAVARPSTPMRAGWRRVELEGRKVRLGEGVRLDFGGIAKGWTVDRAAEAASPLPWAVVNAGGDLRIVGRPPPGGIAVGVEDPADPSRHIVELRLETGALATSSVLSRRWGHGLHQIIDPRTSLPSSTDVVQATVWAPTGAEAEIRSKWAVLAGASVLDRFPGVLVMTDGRVVLNLEPPTDQWPFAAEVPA